MDLKNVGFAPVYEDMQAVLRICDAAGKLVYTGQFDQSVRELGGGLWAQQPLTFGQQVALNGWPGWEEENYEVYFDIVNTDQGTWLTLANEQERSEYGYRIGTITGGGKEWFLGRNFSQSQS